ncbi:MAG: hypothetical protein E7122_09625 [Bacteroidales bacterium]|nr:hypothetical protein [Bacteroidales bacterium]
MVKWRECEMRKLFNFFAAALVMLAAASCEKNEVLPDNNSEGKVVTLKASINNGGTKTSLGGEKGSDDKYPVLWSEGDAIAVIQQEDLNDGSVYIFTLSEGGAGKASASFECNNANGFNPDLEYRAVYPASSVVLSDGKFDGYSFSDTQSYVQNSFGVGAMPMQTSMCIGTECPLSFTNAFGVLKLQLKGAADEKVTSIVVTSNDPLSGEAILMWGSIVLQGTAPENKKVTLDCSATGGVALNPETATYFHIALPAGAESGLSLMIHTDKASYYKQVPVDDKNKVVAGSILAMPVLDLTEHLNPYIENGVDLGDGIPLVTTDGSVIVWAPVNCGYDANHKYGLLYQWGRKYGQGYTDKGDVVNFIDERPTLATGAAEANRNKFYKGDAFNSNGGYGDWLAKEDRSPKLWNGGNEESPVKTEYDPCPEGWRVPTNNELVTLWVGTQVSSDSKTAPSDQVEKTDGIKGFWAKSEVGVNKVFFPVYYVLNYDSTGTYTGGGNNSLYWSSTAGNSNNAMSEVLMMALSTFSGNLTLQATERSRACGYSVRCVKE